MLDAGCGSGRVTRLLLDRLPSGRVIAVDAAPGMVERARPALGERATVLRADLAELELTEPVDAVFSNAVFHWVPDHDRLFARLHAGLRPGGRLVAQCGGEGNISRATRATRVVMERERFRGYFEGWQDDKNYADALTTRTRLEAAGFQEVETWLHDEVAAFGSVDELARFLATVVLGGHLERLPEGERGPFAGVVAEEITGLDGSPRLDYVRLNIDARRAA